MNAALIPQEDNNQALSPIAEYHATELALADLRQRYAATVFDVTSGKGMEAAKKARAELRGYRVALEAKRVEIKAPALQRGRDIDTEAKRITTELTSIEDPIDQQIKAEENRKANEKAEAERIERERIDAINARFDALKALPLQANACTVDMVRELIAEAEAFDPATFPDDMLAAAKYERNLALNALRATLDRAEQAERDRAELEQLRAEQAAMQAERDRLAQEEADRKAEADRQQAEREQAARDERIRAEAAEQAQRDADERLAQAERDKVEALRKAEQEREDAVVAERERAERQARQVEADRLEAQRMQQLADDKRAANRRHVEAVNRKAAAALVAAGGLDERAAMGIVSLIATGQVPGVSIAY